MEGKKIMKRILVFLLASTMLILCSACSLGVSKAMEEAIIAECDRFIEEYDYSDTSLYEVHSITYEIHEIKKHYGQVLVDITWAIYFDDAQVGSSISNEYWVSKMATVLMELEADGKYFFVTHTDEEYNDSIRVVLNGGEAYSGYDDYKNAVNPSKGTSGDRKSGVTDANACSRCDGTGKVTKHYGNSWNDQPGYKYGETCGACGGSGIK